MIRPLSCAIALLFFGLSIYAPSAECANQKPTAPSFDIAAPGRWVRSIAPVLPAGGEPSPGGILYLLMDRQESVEPPALYRHEARQITSENGVQDGASITVSFDPSYQKLVFHSIVVTRDGSKTNRLDRSQIKLLHRERDMERYVYDGAYTAQCDLEDVRIGDIIEFAYTIGGANPVKTGKYSSSFDTQWRHPVRHAFTRVVYPANRKIEYRAHNRELNPTITTTGTVSEWLWEEVDTPPRRIADDTPTDYYPRGWVEFSEFHDWREVVTWAMPLLVVQTPPSRELDERVDQLKAIPNREQQIIAALRFVQDEIRYLGNESGVNSHRPTSPAEVLRRRFGDCKEKVLLLATILRRMDIPAAPALVNTSERGAVAERLPSPDAFDHAILQVKFAGSTYWLDATRAHQHGPLGQIYVTDFKLALVIAAETEALTSATQASGSLPRKRISNRFRIGAPDADSELDVVTEFQGEAAERIRGVLQETGRENLQKDYLQYYTRRFPETERRQPMEFVEIEGQNACRISEFYRIPKLWELNEKENRYEVSLYPGEVDQAIGTSGASQRDEPLRIEHPRDVTEEIHASMFDDWQLPAETNEVANEFFRYREVATVSGRELKLIYSYETLTDRVPVAQLPKYNAAVNKVRDGLGYRLRYTTPAQQKAAGANVEVNWLVAAVLATLLIVACVMAVWYFRTSKLEVPLPSPIASIALTGIKGWLRLVAVHLIVRPFAYAALLWNAAVVVLNAETWRTLTTPAGAAYHPLWAPVLLFELCYGACGLVLCLLLLALFFRKRAAWPRAYATLLAVAVVFVAFDTLVTQRIPAAASASTAARDIWQVVVAAAVWIPYCFRSERVRATFRN